MMLTGASGFVGQATLAALLRRGVETIAVSRRCPRLDRPFQWQALDLLDHAAVADAVRTIRPDRVLHLAWTVEPGQFWTSPANLDWISATLNLVRVARDAGTSRFIGAGTCYEYDWPAGGSCREDVTPLGATTLYDVAKDATRRVLEAFAPTNHLSTAWARLFFLYGPGEVPGRLVPSLARSLAAGRPATCFSGDVVRDFIDVRDAADGLAALSLSPVTGPVNIGTGRGVRIAEVALALGRLAGRPELVRFSRRPDRSNEPPRIVADVTRLNDEVGYAANRSLEAGLSEAWAYWAQAGRGEADA